MTPKLEISLAWDSLEGVLGLALPDLEMAVIAAFLVDLFFAMIVKDLKDLGV